MKKALLTSILSIVACLCLMTGATFALFTSASAVNIAVTSARVEMTASVSGLKYKTLTNQTWTDATDGKTNFDNIGGSAVLSGDTVTLDKMVPGDAVQVTISVDNASTVDVQYKIETVVEGELAPALTLKTTLEGEEIAITNKSTTWSIAKVGEAIADIPVSVEFPDADDNRDYMGKNASVKFIVHAVQGNVATAQSGVVTEEEFAQALANGDKHIAIGAPIQLTRDYGISGEFVFEGVTDDAAIIGRQTPTANGHIQVDGGTVTYKNLRLNEIRRSADGKSEGFYDGIDRTDSASKSSYIDCVIESGITTYAKEVVFTGTTFLAHEEYGLFIYGSSKVTVNDCRFYYGNRAIKIYNEGGAKNVVLNISETKVFADANLVIKKGIIEVDVTYMDSVVINADGVTMGAGLNTPFVNENGGEKTTVNQTNIIFE